MKYRVNLYRERQDRSVVLRRGLLRGAAFGVAIGVEVLLIGFLALSGFQIRERAAGVQGDIARLRSAAAPAHESADLQLARQIVQARLDRVDWSVMLGAVSNSLPRDLILNQVRGGRARGGEPSAASTWTGGSWAAAPTSLR